MSEEEDYSSADDEDYVPSDKEGLSEEDESGEEEDLTVLNEGGDSANRTAGGKGKRKKKKDTELMPRKRRGGIKLEGEENEETNEPEDTENEKLKEEVVKEQEVLKNEKEKKKADDLWASFLSDVGNKPKPKPVPSGGGLGSLTSTCKESKPKATTPTVSNGDGVKSTAPVTQKITITKVFDFAGEAVKVNEEVDVQSKEGRQELKRLKEEKSGGEKVEIVPQNKPLIGKVLGQTESVTSSPKSAGGLGSVLGKIGKKNKLSALTKSKLDWDTYKQEEGIEEDLKIHNRGKEGYIERMAFLQRTDVRQFEIEKSLRQSTSKR